MSIYYPPGVTDEMIDAYFGDDGSCCEKCDNYSYGQCWKKLNELDNMDDEEYNAMTEEEREHFADVDKDDCCDDFEWEDTGEEYEEERGFDYD